MCRYFYTAVGLLSFALSSLHAIELGDPMEDKGTLYKLDDGQTLQLLAVEKKVTAYFADEEGKIIEAPADSIVFEVDDPGHKSDKWRSVLVPADELSLAAPRNLYPPYRLETKLLIRFKDGSTKIVPFLIVQLDRNLDESTEEE